MSKTDDSGRGNEDVDITDAQDIMKEIKKTREEER